MKVYKEVKQIAKYIAKINKLAKKLDEEYDICDIEWETAEFVSLKKKT